MPRYTDSGMPEGPFGYGAPNCVLTDSSEPSDRAVMQWDVTSTYSQFGVKANDTANSGAFAGLYDTDKSDAAVADDPQGRAVGLIVSGVAYARVSGAGDQYDGVVLDGSGAFKSASGVSNPNICGRALVAWTTTDLIPIDLSAKGGA